MRVHATPFVLDWEKRRTEYKQMLAEGKIPTPYGTQKTVAERPFLMGQAAGAIDTVQTAKEIVDEMVGQAHDLIRSANSCLVAKL